MSVGIIPEAMDIKLKSNWYNINKYFPIYPINIIHFIKNNRDPIKAIV